MQVPAGTIQDGETAEEAAARELMEETGLVSLKAMTFLGERIYDMRPFEKHEFHRRFFYHVVHDDDGPDQWSHVETHAGPAPIRLDFIWWQLAEGVPPLVAGHGALIEKLLVTLTR